MNPPTRNRSWKRTLGLSLVALVLLLLLAYVVALFITGRQLASTVREIESRRGPLTVESIVPPRVEKDQNRVPPIRAAIEIMDTDLPDEAPGESTLAPLWEVLGEGGALSTAQTDRAVQLLHQNRVVFDLLDRAVARPAANWDLEYRLGLKMPTPPLIEALRLGHLGQVQLAIEIEEDSCEGAVQALDRGFVVAASLAQESILIGQLVRMGVNRQTLSGLRRLLQGCGPTDEELVKFEGWLEEASTPLPAYSGLVGELKVFAAELLTMERGGQLHEALEIPRQRWLERFVVRWLGRPMLRADLRFYLTRMDRLIEISQVPAFQRGASLPDRFDEPPKIFVISRIILPNLVNAIEKQDAEEARLALARTAIALCRYRLARGTYPYTLDRLVPEYLAEVPVDPFTGLPVTYRRQGDGFYLEASPERFEENSAHKGDSVLRWEIGD